jgi:predicted nucleotidyltransferase
VSIPREKQCLVEELCRTSGVTYLRLFGSALKTFEQAQDVDLVIGPTSLTVEKLAKLSLDFESIFQKPVDLIQLQGELNPVLVGQIAQYSQPIFEDKELGRYNFSEDISRAVAIAEDELLAVSEEMRAENLKSVLGRLRNA